MEDATYVYEKDDWKTLLMNGGQTKAMPSWHQKYDFNFLYLKFNFGTLW